MVHSGIKILSFQNELSSKWGKHLLAGSERSALSISRATQVGICSFLDSSPLPPSTSPPPFPLLHIRTTRGTQAKQILFPEDQISCVIPACHGSILSERSAQELFVESRDNGKHHAVSLHSLLHGGDGAKQPHITGSPGKIKGDMSLKSACRGCCANGW